MVAACATPRTAPVPETPAAPATAQASYAGDWDLTVMDTPAGTVKGILTLTETADDALGGTINVNGSDVNLRSVERTADGLLITFYSSDYQTDIDFRLKGEPSADELTGTALNTYMTVATRKK